MPLYEGHIVIREAETQWRFVESFFAHSVDAWVLAATLVGALEPTDKRLYYWTPIISSRRQLHVLQPSSRGTRKRYGGTRSLGISKGTLVKCKNGELRLVGGHSKNGISLHDSISYKRLERSAKPTDLKILKRITFRKELIC